jgi:3D (Asp-Asp-Asp) domain-containing protein
LTTTRFNPLAPALLALAASALLTSCGTTRTASRSLPPYEPPIAKADFQNVRTTAYTHTEDDHVAYGARNALGGILQSATVPTGPYRQAPPRALPITSAHNADDDDVTFALMTREKRIELSKKQQGAKKGKVAKASKARKPEPPRIGSAAADWSRWPVGTTFRILSTGQMYRVDDYGWALAGRNTIDLYMGSRSEMNNWGVRQEPIQVLAWGDPQRSLALLQQRQAYKHCRRMALELQGLHDQAAALR